MQDEEIIYPEESQPQTQIMRPPQMGLMTAPTPAQIDQLVLSVERMAEARKRMIMVCAKSSEPNDWIDFGGKPYLQGQGGMRIAAVCGIRVGAPVWTREEWVEDDVFCECVITATWPSTGSSVSEIGACSSRDKFFTGDGRSRLNQFIENCDGNRLLAVKQLRADVRKKAMANGVGRAVAAVMGIKGLTWDSLAEYGLTPEKCGGRVTFNAKNAKGAAASTPTKSAAATKSAASTPAATPAAKKRAAPAPADRVINLWELGSIGANEVVGIERAWPMKWSSKTITTAKGPADITSITLGITTPEGEVVSFETSMWGKPEFELNPENPISVVRAKQYKEWKGVMQYSIEGIAETTDVVPEPELDLPPGDLF